MNSKIDALSNDRSDRQVEMMQRWQDSIQENQQKLKRTNGVDNDTDADIQRKIRNGEMECPTCANRRYVDVSDDAGVSFQTPTKISPGQSMSAVLGHEREHVMRNQAEALSQNREVTKSSVSLQYATCPDCGRRYVAGGLTHTETQSVEKNGNPFEKNQFDMKV